MPPAKNEPDMLRFLPWRFILRVAARRYGVIDPIAWLGRLRAFARPSEVQEPIELLRAGVVFHARGLVNVKAIQHNLDWVWPFWVEKQFKPGDPSFVPRAFSFSHINLTHRNWTSVGLPDIPIYPIVDPRGLITPLHDGWSVDFWIVTRKNRKLIPSRISDDECSQQLNMGGSLSVATECRKDNLRISSRVEMTCNVASPVLRTDVSAESNEDGWLIAAIRPYNPEGVQFIDGIELDDNGSAIIVNGNTAVKFDQKPSQVRMAHYEDGDVYLDLETEYHQSSIRCDAGMATAAAMFPISSGTPCEVRLEISLDEEIRSRKLSLPAHKRSWSDAINGLAELRVADERTQFLFDAAIRTIVLLSAGELVPGPNTYRRFWFRDACLMMNPMLAIGLVARAERVLSEFPSKQTRSGYFSSQEGEWDSNGQVLWIAARVATMTGKRLPSEMEEALEKAVKWLSAKRLSPDTDPRKGPAGLLPAGFSAEHLGPNDFYYWDDFWAIGGLRAIASYWQQHGQIERADEADELADAYSESIEKSIAGTRTMKRRGAIPAAPSRRMDAGAVGSMVADYPLQLYPPGERRLLATLEYLYGHCFFKGGFFQEMIHSGINAYLTLDLAQTWLRAGDPRFADLIRDVAKLASPTGQWPEAIHPNTLGGCMGDGQHGWAAGEWIMMIRNCFVREEEHSRTLVIGSGILPEWLGSEGNASFGPTLTLWGTVTVEILKHHIGISASWLNLPPHLSIAIPGYEKIEGILPGESIPLIPVAS
jgi:hypothetical protein